MAPHEQPLPSAIPKAAPQDHHQSSNSPPLPEPKLRLQLNHLRHPASKAFLQLIPDVVSTLETALKNIVQNLYTSNSKETAFTPSVPPTRSVTVILHDFGGVAYTTGKELDNDHKEIHFSLSYIQTSAASSNAVNELTGVLTHELVHCYQHTAPPPPEGNGVPSPPGGLIEGIADFVRLKAGLEPPHWKQPTSAKDRPDKWDQGYQHTAFFLAWLEDVRVGKGAVGLLNDRLLRVGYTEETGFWKGLFGVGVRELWEDYGKYLDTLEK
ncbi:hypothetical protein ASPWEDRAFT_500481 [Aspergillus wentii DTO 134E9]|uniref:Uncharacterized protein n=1 Tax=Aspergillus wentii DTO 134E9 TaxID=1073089 RepID=A0A1L9RJZ0_ASPWE|nr:uncharacterized protein ASPWEDRAFT_500481 [Aspergillus wentii DTO 134E9]OJJ35223.1 hypothetical protein ASPWEDRAFT_500481 [Aspergillus wentii DTO 134E9]